ncbi:M56 family metallopeptidase [Flexithrix dorotheae]|uniref:M56 family metallopeptidase n=1 Tax=Flexithrix dorotheae TaxID=70993 RepID=UPI00037E121F|nr:M56 family metallopeptidase [Flexithrix dorotheae]
MKFLIYLLETSACLISCYLLYFLVFKKLTHFQWNRFYLLGSLVLSFIIPALNIQVTQEETPIPKDLYQIILDNNKVESAGFEHEDALPNSENESISLSENYIEEKSGSWDWKISFVAIYLLGTLLASIRFFRGIIKLIKLIRTSPRESRRGFTWVKMPVGFQPSSFFLWVLIDEEKLIDREILKHEMTHVKQWHSLDILIFELATILLWFNPVIYLFKRDLRQIHEYLADANAMGEKPKFYAQKMLTLATGNKIVLLTNSFAFLPLKHRIKMLTRIKSSPISKLNFLLSLPIIGLLFFTFSCVKEDFAEITGSGEVAQRKIKSIKSYYVDEMGDQPEKNGTVIGEVYFDMEGKVETIRTSYSDVLRPNKELSYYQKNPQLLFQATQNDVHWLIDGYIYNFSHSEIVMDPKLQKVFELNADEKKVLSGGNVVKYTNTQEFNLEGKNAKHSFKSRTENYFEKGKRIKEEVWYSGINEGFFQLGSGRDFIFDDKGKLLLQRKFLLNNGSKVYQTEGHLTYNDKQLIDTYSSFDKSEFKRKAQYFYDENGLRTSNQVYNSNNQLEFTINFAYEFYD